jgi:hypothetical protein
MEDFANALETVKRMGSTDPKEEYLRKVTKTAKGSFIGLVGGLMAGWYYKKNLYVYGLLGTIIGAGANYFLTEMEK